MPQWHISEKRDDIMRDYKLETEKRVAFIKEKMKEAHAMGLVFGNSGGKDSALVGILCSKATENVLGVAMPCHSKRNYGEDMDDAKALSDFFGIKMITVDLTDVRNSLTGAINEDISLSALANIAPRLRMTTLYSIAQTRNSLVVGTGNKSERFMGYFTKWGDGAFDLNPIGDLTATEIFEFLRYLKAPKNIIEKAPSAGLFEGQTDEVEMGVTYKAIDEYITTGDTDEKSKAIIERFHRISEHKRKPSPIYGE